MQIVPGYTSYLAHKSLFSRFIGIWGKNKSLIINSKITHYTRCAKRTRLKIYFKKCYMANSSIVVRPSLL